MVSCLWIYNLVARDRTIPVLKGLFFVLRFFMFSFALFNSLMYEQPYDVDLSLAVHINRVLCFNPKRTFTMDFRIIFGQYTAVTRPERYVEK